MVQRAKAIELIESKLTPLMQSLVMDARGSGQQSPYQIEIYRAGENDLTGTEIATFQVRTNANGDLEWDKNDKNNALQRMIAPLAMNGGDQELRIHVHGSVAKPTEGRCSLNFAGIGGLAAEA